MQAAPEAHGATIDGRPVGSFGLGSFSFYATKNVTTGEGGVVTTSDAALARRLRLLRNQGMSEVYRYEVVGGNLRMTDVHAAMGIPQLERLAEVNAVRSAKRRGAHPRPPRNCSVASAAGGAGPTPPRLAPVHGPVAERPRPQRRPLPDGGRRHAGGGYYPALVWDHPPYRGHPCVAPDEMPRAADSSARCLSLPIHPRLAPADLERVITALVSALA